MGAAQVADYRPITAVGPVAIDGRRRGFTPLSPARISPPKVPLPLRIPSIPGAVLSLTVARSYPSRLPPDEAEA